LLLRWRTRGLSGPVNLPFSSPQNYRPAAAVLQQLVVIQWFSGLR
jgi:hypothetical protein